MWNPLRNEWRQQDDGGVWKLGHANMIEWIRGFGLELFGDLRVFMDSVSLEGEDAGPPHWCTRGDLGPAELSLNHPKWFRLSGEVMKCWSRGWMMLWIGIPASRCCRGQSRGELGRPGVVTNSAWRNWTTAGFGRLKREEHSRRGQQHRGR